MSFTGGSTAITNFSLTAATTVTRVNAAGRLYVDSHGQTWQTDKGFSGGLTYSTTLGIARSSDPTLFQTERYGAPLQYSFSVANGSYTVDLYFAEIWSGCFSVGGRVLNLHRCKGAAFSNLDVFAQAGGNTALEKSTTASVSNGTLTISFGSITRTR